MSITHFFPHFSLFEHPTAYIASGWFIHVCIQTVTKSQFPTCLVTFFFFPAIFLYFGYAPLLLILSIQSHLELPMNLRKAYVDGHGRSSDWTK